MERRDTINKRSAGGELGPVCHDCSNEGFGEDRPKTLYVHLMTGEVAAVEDVTGLKLTSKAIVIERQSQGALTYLRSQVYYACCEKDRPPPSQ